MKILLNIAFSPISLDIPDGAVRITQWNKHGDHKHVLADYSSGPFGDIDTGTFFIENANGLRTAQVQAGDWIFDMADGTFRTVRQPLANAEEAVKFALEHALEALT